MDVFPTLHLPPWTPQNAEEAQQTSSACYHLIKTLLLVKEERADLDKLLLQALSCILPHQEDCERVIEVCIARHVHEQTNNESPFSPSRHRALLLLRTLHSEGYCFKDDQEDWIRSELLPIMEWSNQSRLPYSEGDLLPEALKTLTAMAFPWHMNVSGKTVGLHLLKRSSEFNFPRMAAALRLSDVPLLGRNQRQDTLEKHLLSLMTDHLGVAYKPSQNVPLCESHCQQMVALVQHVGGIALVEHMHKTYALDLSRQKTISPGSKEAFQQTVVAHCTRVLEAQLLQEVLEDGAQTSSFKTRRRV